MSWLQLILVGSWTNFTLSWKFFSELPNTSCHVISVPLPLFLDFIYNLLFLMAFSFSISLFPYTAGNWHLFLFQLKLSWCLFCILRYKIVAELIFSRTFNSTDWFFLVTTKMQKNLSAWWDCLELWFWMGGNGVKVPVMYKLLPSESLWSWKMLFHFWFTFQSLYNW